MAREIDVSKFYDERAKNFGIDPRTVGWRSIEQQKLRFDVLFRDIHAKKLSLIDLGSGLGDLYSYLILQDRTIMKYYGVEISKEMTKLSERLIGEYANVEIINNDFLNVEIDKADFVVASGSMNLATNEDSYAFVANVIEKFSPVIIKGFLCNFLSTKVDFQQELHAHFDPERIKHLFQENFKNVRIIENYGLYEFTVQALR
jgi:SAM-dependent methyltransferase